MRHRHFTIAGYLVAIIALVDQFSKHWLLDTLEQNPHAIEVNPFLNLVLVWNKGVTFGLFSQFGHRYVAWFFVTVGAVILFFLGRWLWRTSSSLVGIGLGLIMGGAIGNIIDRVHYGAVVDFLDFHYMDYHWYAFNIADAAICTGVGLLLLDNLARGR